MSAIIPKKLGSQKLKIIGNITIIDFICCVSFIVIALIIAIPLTIIGIIGQFITAIFIFGFLAIFLLPNGKSGMRIYYLIYLFFKYKSSNKKYNYDSKNYPTSLLIPYKELIGNINELGVIKTDKLFENKDFFVCAVELEGYNLLNMSYDEQIRKINILKMFWSSIEVNCSLIKLEKNFNKIKGTKYLNTKINELKAMKLTEKQVNSRVEQLKDSLQLFEDDGELGKDNFQHKYYLFLYCHDYKQCKEIINSVVQKGQNSGLNVNPLNGYEIINTIKYLLDPSEEVVNSQWRVNKGWIIKERNIKRTIITKFGEITYKRTKFINKYNGECSFLADPYMEVEKYQRISFSLEKEILDSFNHGESHIIVWEKFKKSNITKRTISNIIKRNANFNFKTLNSINEEFKNDLPVYVDIDDCWTTVRFKNQKRWIRVRVAVAYQGKINEGKRNKLINKKVFLKTFLKGNSCNTYDYSLWLKNEIEKNYGSVTNKKLIICGDGANWISEIADFLGAKFVLDKFHLFQKIYFCFPYKRSKNKSKLMKLYELAIEKYDSKNIKSLINFLYENIDSNGLKNQRIKDTINYISNNIKGIENHFKDWYIGCFAESAVSHLVKSIKGYGAKIYNKKTFELLINLKAAKINNIDILEIIYSKFKENLEDQIYDNLEIFIPNEYDQFEKTEIRFAKVPILESKKSAYSEIIRKLVH